MRRRLLLLAALACLAALVPAGGAHAAEGEWASDQPVAAGIGVPAPLGRIGDIKFWAPNRGVLITGGNEGLPAGVYAYDGVSWHLYSTVCGGAQGRIAWAGPEDFWTVSDYAQIQEGVDSELAESARTLCHFENGAVVASYAQPVGTAETYERMEAATCEGAANCWFAGMPLSETAPNRGAFHLHWDGTGLTEVPSQTEAQPQVHEPGGGAVTGLAFYAGGLYETAEETPFLRQIVPGTPEVFQPVTMPESVVGPFKLSSSGDGLWAFGEDGATAARFGPLGFEAVPLAHGVGRVEALAAEPGGAAWVGASGEETRLGGTATVTKVGADGSVGATIQLPSAAEEIDGKGGAQAMTCPAPGQCWLATTKGWLFHLGGSLPQDTDPAMHVLITSRPADGSTRSFVPPGLPEDNSGETETSRRTEVPLREHFPHRHKPRPLVTKVHQKVVGKSVLELTFLLHARAHVRLIAKWHGKAVAHTARLTLAKGPHAIHLRLDPKRWPTGLDFQVHPAPWRKKK
jgi:hypothetical protein